MLLLEEGGGFNGDSEDCSNSGRGNDGRGQKRVRERVRRGEGRESGMGGGEWEERRDNRMKGGRIGERESGGDGEKA